MTMPDAQRVTRILGEISAGRTGAADELLPLVYEQLRAIAQHRMNSERGGGRGGGDHTLQATALVHEAYLKLVGNADIHWNGRGHFFAAAAEAMRRILVDHARARLRAKRGGPGCGPGGGAGGERRRLDLSIAEVADLARGENPQEIVALDDAIRRLQIEEQRAADIVRLRFSAGLTVDETAAALGVSPRTVDLDWSFARAWLYRALRVDQSD